MRPVYARRQRNRNVSKSDCMFQRKDNQEQGFFDTPAHESFFQPAAAQVVAPGIQRKCDKCEEEEKKVQRKEASPAAPSAITSTGAVPSDNGASLPAGLNYFFSSRMGGNFGDVKIHNSSQADKAAKAVNAKAYTYGNDIVFKDGEYNPGTYEGKKLLAHELTHVMQQTGKIARKEDAPAAGSDPAVQADPASEPVAAPEEERTWETFVSVPERFYNTTHYGNCAGVSVGGLTNANYSSSATSTGTTRTAPSCEGCTGDECITVTGTVVSRFSAAPTVSLPTPPGGLTPCETAAVQTFINTTLRAHEQQHVAAFNTYKGTVRTPFTYTGCRTGLDAHVQEIHDGIEVPRRAASDALSAALDPFNVPIPCDCPDPVEPEAAGPTPDAPAIPE